MGLRKEANLTSVDHPSALSALSDTVAMDLSSFNERRRGKGGWSARCELTLGLKSPLSTMNANTNCDLAFTRMAHSLLYSLRLTLFSSFLLAAHLFIQLTARLFIAGVDFDLRCSTRRAPARLRRLQFLHCAGVLFARRFPDSRREFRT